jgi:hypothetical protein
MRSSGSCNTPYFFKRDVRIEINPSNNEMEGNDYEDDLGDYSL